LEHLEVASVDPLRQQLGHVDGTPGDDGHQGFGRPIDLRPRGGRAAARSGRGRARCRGRWRGRSRDGSRHHARVAGRRRARRRLAGGGDRRNRGCRCRVDGRTPGIARCACAADAGEGEGRGRAGEAG
ncbi:MAG: hypothetical protein ACK55I_40950, partial [bacterium]